jgi:hypothetical protein
MHPAREPIAQVGADMPTEWVNSQFTPTESTNVSTDSDCMMGTECSPDAIAPVRTAARWRRVLSEQYQQYYSYCEETKVSVWEMDKEELFDL